MNIQKGTIQEYVDKNTNELIREWDPPCECSQKYGVETVVSPPARGYRYSCSDFCLRCGGWIRDRYYD
jgi:hypothetical protein